MTVETTTPKPKKKHGLGFKTMVCLSALIIGTVGLVAYQTYRVMKTAEERCRCHCFGPATFRRAH